MTVTARPENSGHTLGNRITGCLKAQLAYGLPDHAPKDRSLHEMNIAEGNCHHTFLRGMAVALEHVDDEEDIADLRKQVKALLDLVAAHRSVVLEARR